ncbi:MAG: aminotransferase class IV [Bacteroidetes bacterium]|nr:aminotransferase class IV [Bacteroidota bacterium]
MNYYCSDTDNKTQKLFFDNRSFRYGDGFFESALWIDGRMPLWKFHCERILESIAYIFSAPTDVDLDFIQSKIASLIDEHHLKIARVRITFWRSGQGTYRSITDAFEYLIEIGPLDFVPYQNLPIISAGICEQIQKPCIKLSNFKTNSSLYFVMAQREAKAKQVDEVILLNTDQHICEGSYQNIFLIKDKIIYTPPSEDGCIHGAFRAYFIDFCHRKNIPIRIESLNLDSYNRADEVFFTSALRGISASNSIESIETKKLWESIKQDLFL